MSGSTLFSAVTLVVCVASGITALVFGTPPLKFMALIPLTASVFIAAWMAMEWQHRKERERWSRLTQEEKWNEAENGPQEPETGPKHRA